MVFGVCLLLVVGLAPQGQSQTCKSKFSIDYVGLWSEYYNACNSEMKTMLQYEINYPGAYKSIWAQVDNTTFSEQYWAWQLCPTNPPCDGTVIDWTHCTQLTDHRLMMDVIGGVGEYLGYNEHVFAVEYYASQPD
jgi:hypothetical protein